jgi:hypothetical protein
MTKSQTQTIFFLLVAVKSISSHLHMYGFLSSVGI